MVKTFFAITFKTLSKKEYKYVSDRQSVNNIVAYELETTQTKRNTFEFNVNLEALNIMLLDRVYISNTANMQNESTGLIKNVLVNNGYLEGFELYSDVDIPENAKIIIRSLDYETEKPVIKDGRFVLKGHHTYSPLLLTHYFNLRNLFLHRGIFFHDILLHFGCQSLHLQPLVFGNQKLTGFGTLKGTNNALLFHFIHNP